MATTHRDEKYNAIIDILKDKEGKRLRFMSLYKDYISWLRNYKDYTTLKNKRGRKIIDIKKFNPSKNEFSNILDKMIEDKYLIKEKENNYHYYVLTEYAISVDQIKILNRNDKQDIFKKIYKKLIVQEILKEEVKLNSHKEFDDFLAQLEINKENIIWGSIVQNRNPDIASLIYPDLFPKTNRYYKQDLTHELWNSTRKKSRIIPLELFCFPEYGYPYFEIYRTEYWKLNKNGKNNFISVEYRFRKPGITTDELDNITNLNDDLLEALSTLQKIKLIKTKMIGRKIFYTIADGELFEFLENLREIILTQYRLLKFRMDYFENPTEQEKRNMEAFFGKKKFRDILLESETKRVLHKRSMRKCKDLNEYSQILREECKGQHGYFSLHDDIKEFSEKQTKKPKTKRGLKQEVLEYYNYIREKNKKSYLEYSPINLENEEIEFIKIRYEGIISKYSFLKEILYDLCPKVFDPIDEEFRKALIENEIAKDFATDLISERLLAIDVEDAYNPKTMKRIPYTLRETKESIKDKMKKNEIDKRPIKFNDKTRNKIKILNLTPE
jgi:hypothetical protein